MFRRKKDEPAEPPKAPEPIPVRAAAQPGGLTSQTSSQAAPERAERPLTPAAPARPEGARPAAAAPSAPTAAAPKPATPAPRSAEEEAQRLIVGKGIVLNGEITACDRLVVEGRVEATLNKTRSIEIAPTGVFKGAAEIEQATVGGLYDGKLTCKGKLTIRGAGRVQGEVRYGEIEIEAGGVISGNVGATSG